MANSKKQELIRELVEATDLELDDEMLIHKLLDNKISTNLNNAEDTLTTGQKAADAVANFAGSWKFIISFILIIAAWIVLNLLLVSKAFDPYPFILLNLVLSCVAAIQAPLIMMSQNRQESKDRVRSESDYKINLKNELVIADLHQKLDSILENQIIIMDYIETQQGIKSEEKAPEPNDEEK